MRCTECSRKVSPIVAIDIDGTLSEYHKSLAEFVGKYHNILICPDPWDGYGDFEDYLGISQAQYREAKLAYRQGGFKRFSEPMPDAFWFMQHLSLMDLEVWITTTRPWSRLDNVDPDTRFWLERHSVRYDHLLFDDNKYEKLSKIVDPHRVIAVVDDLEEMILESEKFLPTAKSILIARPHNVHHRDGHRVAANFQHAILIIEDEYMRFTDTHE